MLLIRPFRRFTGRILCCGINFNVTAYLEVIGDLIRHHSLIRQVSLDLSLCGRTGGNFLDKFFQLFAVRCVSVVIFRRCNIFLQERNDCIFLRFVSGKRTNKNRIDLCVIASACQGICYLSGFVFFTVLTICNIDNDLLAVSGAFYSRSLIKDILRHGQPKVAICTSICSQCPNSIFKCFAVRSN